MKSSKCKSLLISHSYNYSQVNYHPTICIVTGKQYLAVEGEKLVSNKPTTFGSNSVFILEESGTRGQYLLQGANGKYLSVADSGEVSANKATKDPTCHIALEFSGANMAIKSISSGCYYGVVSSIYQFHQC
jgi:hypothetical protein